MPGCLRRNRFVLNNLSDANTGTINYDLKGNLTSAAGWTYDYDAQNRLTTMQGPGMTITMTYDPLNRIVTRQVNGTVTQNVWDGWNLIEEHRPDWSIQRCYLHGANQNEMVAAFHGNVHTNHWYWQDGRANTSHITGDPGNLLERYTYDLSGAPKFYDEWGGERAASVYDTRFLFAGSPYLPDTGIYDMRNRFYHMALNRFLQTDPIGFKGDPLNLYRYCHNDPADFSDPMGLDSNVWLFREYADRDAPGKYVIYNDRSNEIYNGPANRNPFYKGTHGIRAGDYTLQPKGDKWGKKGIYPSDQPAITGSAKNLKPGQPNRSYTAPALVHKPNPFGSGPDSAGCITVEPKAESLTKQVMAHDKNLGGTTHIHIRDGADQPRIRRAGS